MELQGQTVDILDHFGNEACHLAKRYGLVLKEAGKDNLAKQAQQGNTFYKDVWSNGEDRFAPPGHKFLSHC